MWFGYFRELLLLPELMTISDEELFIRHFHYHLHHWHHHYNHVIFFLCW